MPHILPFKPTFKLALTPVQNLWIWLQGKVSIMKTPAIGRRGQRRHFHWRQHCQLGHRSGLPRLHCALQRTFTENVKHIFPGRELRGHSPNFHIRVSVSDLYIPTIELPILLGDRSLTDTWMWKLGLRHHNSQKKKSKTRFSLQRHRRYWQLDSVHLFCHCNSSWGGVPVWHSASNSQSSDLLLQIFEQAVHGYLKFEVYM